MYDTLYLLAEVLIWVLCPFLIGLILLQGGAGDISSAFGGGGQLDSTLGVGASRKMAKVTGWLGLLFMILVLFLAIPYKGAIRDRAAPVATDAQVPGMTSPTSVPSATSGSSAPGLVSVEGSAPALLSSASQAEALTSATATPAEAPESATSASTATGG